LFGQRPSRGEQLSVNHVHSESELMRHSPCLQRWSTAELLDHPFIRKAGRIQSLQRLINRYSEFKRQSASHARADSEVPNPTINGTIDGEDDGWDFGNGTVLTTRGASQNETAFAGTIRPGKGSEARVFERDVQPYQVQATLGDAYPGETDERRRTFIVNDDVPDDFEEVSCTDLSRSPTLMAISSRHSDPLLRSSHTRAPLKPTLPKSERLRSIHQSHVLPPFHRPMLLSSESRRELYASTMHC